MFFEKNREEYRSQMKQLQAQTNPNIGFETVETADNGVAGGQKKRDVISEKNQHPQRLGFEVSAGVPKRIINGGARTVMGFE